jgi:transglutaminase-like putative cysteine protease
MITVWGVIAADWTKGMNMLTFVGFGAILIGIMLARSVLPALIAHLFSIIIGIGWAFWVTARLLPSSYTWLERWENLAMRLYNWYLVARQGGVSYDNLMFILQMGVILWAVGYLTIWFVVRSGKPWTAIVPGGLVLLINLYYGRDISTWFVVYLVISLLLIVRFNLFEQEIRWRSEGIFFRPDINFDFLRDGLIFILLVVAFAWLTPPLLDTKTIGVLDEFQGSWREWQNDWNRMFADLNYSDRSVYDSFGSSLTLGGARQLSDDPVMDVSVEGVGRYWRAAVYDYYSGDGWVSRDEDRASFGADSSPLALPVFEMREAVTQTFTYHRDNATVLYAMSNPIYLDRSARATFNELPGDLVTEEAEIPGWTNLGEPWVEEVTYLRSNATVDKNESYQIVSLVSRATVEQLSAANDDYPVWVTDRYLNLPPSITDRTRQLAQEITVGETNNFAKAQAIERYLRNNIAYNESIAAPPAGVDKVDYVLFSSKEAYCDYYATSMIVMLRTLGIPARLAAGFARGTFNADTAVYEVRNRDAHSWVEVYFPRYGWIEFEPTAAQPNIIRPTSPENDSSFASGSFLPDDVPAREEDLGPNNIPIDEETVTGGELPFSISLPFLNTRIGVSMATATLGTIVIIGGLLFLLAALWWRRGSYPTAVKEEEVAVLYQKMVRLASWIGLRIRPWQTPYEHSASLQQALPEQSNTVQTITREYVYYAYSGRRQEQGQGTEATLAWYQLRTAMLRQAIKQRLPNWLKNRL